MSFFFKILAFLVMIGVVIALGMGLRNMMKGGDANRSNKLMQLRSCCLWPLFTLPVRLEENPWSRFQKSIPAQAMTARPDWSAKSGG
jgi:Hypoxia induced protein conserved region